MKKLILIVALLLCPFFGQAQVATTGYHRVSQVLTRAPQSITAQVVPNAKIAVTNTATGLAATIYYDPLLTSVINPPLLTADNSGNYSYYVALNYCVTETITSPGQNQPIVIPNICANSSGGTVLGLDANGTPVTPTAGVFNFTATSPIVLTPSGNTFNFSCPSCSSSSGGTSVSVNGGSSLGNLNINAATPTADASFLALTPKISGANAIIEAPYATGSQYGVTVLGAGGANPWLGYTPAQVFTLTTIGTSGQATYSSNIINIPQYQCALTLTTVGGSGPSTLSACTLNIPQYTGGSGSAISVTSRTAPSSISGSQQAYDALPSITPVCDIRTQGAIINGSTPIDSAVQACVNLIGTVYGGTGTVFLPCIGYHGASGCFWLNPSSLTGSSLGGGEVKIVLQGGLQTGSTFSLPGFANLFGDGGGNILQFQTGTSPAAITGPGCLGTLGTAITSANTATNITINISGNVYGGGPSCTIANLPVYSAISLAALTSSTATGARVTNGGEGVTTLTTVSAIRIPPGANITVTGCSDSSLNITNGQVASSDFSAKTITYLQATSSPTTGTGCTVTGFNDDSYESARVLCSNGTSGTFNGVTYSSCGANQVTIMTKRTHLSTDSWGEVGAGPAFNTYTPQTWSDITINGVPGMSFWAEGSTHLVMNNVGVQASASLTSGAAELSADQLNQFHDVFFQANIPGFCLGGGCYQPSYPRALLCDSDAPVGGYYSANYEACYGSVIDQGSAFYGGGIKLGDGANQITGLPRIEQALYEEVWDNAITIDNRDGIGTSNILSLRHEYLQDNVSGWPQDLFGYTDNAAPTGVVEVDDYALEATPFLCNSYFNGQLIVNGINQVQVACLPKYLNAPSAASNEGGRIKAEIQNEGDSFGPQIVPYGSLPMTAYTVSALNALCVTAGTCTVSALVGPDGPSGQALSFEMDTPDQVADIIPGTWTGNLYVGDVFLLFSHVRPGEGNNITTGDIGNYTGNNNGFYISGGTYAPSYGTGNDGTGACAPGAFGTQLGNDGWGAEVAICYVNAASTGTTVSFHLAASNGGSGTRGNQYAEYGWAFIPGPNNPACIAAGTCLLSSDQIELARRDQYHGFVPPGSPSGVAITGELVSIPGFDTGVTTANYLTASWPMSVISSSAAPTIFTSSTVSTQIDINNTHSGGKNWAIQTAAAGTFTIEDITDSVNPLQMTSTGIVVMGGSKLMDRCSGGTMDGAYVAASSTQSAACTTAGGSLVSTGITTP